LVVVVVVLLVVLVVLVVLLLLLLLVKFRAHRDNLFLPMLRMAFFQSCMLNGNVSK
jgi:hypothetical protein